MDVGLAADAFARNAPEIVAFSVAMERVLHYRRESHYDLLTGLMNRRGLYSKARRITIRKTASVLAVDLDCFKQINTEGGHLQGDAVLQKIAELAHAIVRGPAANGLASRTGGDEFTLLCPHDEAGALHAAECLRRLVANHDFKVGHRVTVSVGVATARPGESLDGVWARADDAAYAAKSAGGNRVEKHTAATPASPHSSVRNAARYVPSGSKLARIFVDGPRAILLGTCIGALRSPIRLLWSNLRKGRHTRRTAARIVRRWKRFRK